MVEADVGIQHGVEYVRRGGVPLQAERKRRYAEFLETMAQDVPHIWVAMPNEIWAMTTRVRLPDKNLSFLMLLNAKDWERTA